MRSELLGGARKALMRIKVRTIILLFGVGSVAAACRDFRAPVKRPAAMAVETHPSGGQRTSVPAEAEPFLTVRRKGGLRVRRGSDVEFIVLSNGQIKRYEPSTDRAELARLKGHVDVDLLVRRLDAEGFFRLDARALRSRFGEERNSGQEPGSYRPTIGYPIDMSWIEIEVSTTKGVATLDTRLLSGTERLDSRIETLAALRRVARDLVRAIFDDEKAGAQYLRIKWLTELGGERTNDGIRVPSATNGTPR